MIARSHLILYVSDQDSSMAFYAAVLDIPPRLHVPGMTEFELGKDVILGLMPIGGVLRLLGNNLPHSAAPSGLLRAELYLMVDDPSAYYGRAIRSGAQRVSDLAERDWGDLAAYCLDLDGHVLAFALERSHPS